MARLRNNTNSIPLNRIRVGGRHRRDLGDIDGLARTIKEVGLLHAVVVTPDFRLIAGKRRYEACKQLGWKAIPVRVVDLEQIVKGEFAENAHRKDFLPSEVDSIRRVLEATEKAAAKQRMSQGGKGAKVSHPSRATDRIGAFASISGRQVEKIAKVCEAARTDPRCRHLVEQMDRHGVNRAYRALHRMRDEERVRGLQPHPGKFRTLIVDAPYSYDDIDGIFGDTGCPYATMTAEQILALPVARWAEDNAHLYLWTTNVFMPLAVRCMQAWGFEHKSILTWIKPGMGLGSYFRGTTEHCVFGIRGRLMTRATDIPTHFQAPVGAHSEKPAAFYRIVERASYLPAGEAFQRTPRPGFVNLYQPAQQAAA